MTYPGIPKRGSPEPYFTIKRAAAQLNVKYWALRRAINLGLIPAYTLGNTRKLVLLSEVTAFIQAQQVGGRNDE